MDTLDSGAATLRAAVAELPGPQLEDLVRLDRYDPGAIIGKGGMGEIRQCHDVRLNRHIALKTATTRNKAELSRFVREAQVQGQLEHPSIVPVYELGIGADGAPYFAMKRVRGESLFDVLNALFDGNVDHQTRFPRRKLLSAFLQVCQAVDYAHTNGWMHRDLKPANIMLGDFGEVYVLDWGLARRLDSKDDEGPRDATMHLAPMGLTTPGSLMGTPGYMAPEQVMGRPADLRSDVYALGAILFEVLTNEMLAKGSTTMELLINTREGCDAHARRRVPHADVPPELEAICVKASALEPAQRYATVRELHDALDRVLAGERDHELRAELARQHADAAARADALSKTDEANELDHRKTALREVGLALALDPTYRPAMTTLVELMGSAPKTTPPETRAEIDLRESQDVRSALRMSATVFAVVACMSLAISLSQPSGYVILNAALFFLASAVSGYGGYHVKNVKSMHALPTLVLSNIAIMSLFYLDGPLTLLPAFAAVNTLAFRVSLNGKYHRLIIGLGFMAVLVPILGSYFGLLPQAFRFVNGNIELMQLALRYDEKTTVAVLTVCFLGTIGISSFVVGRVRDRNAHLARGHAMQAWNLQQLLPADAKPKVVMPVEPVGAAMCVIERAEAAIEARL